MKFSNRTAYPQYLGEDSTELPLSQGSELGNLSAWLNPIRPAWLKPPIPNASLLKPHHASWSSWTPFAYTPLQIPMPGRSAHCVLAQILVIVYPPAVFLTMILHFFCQRDPKIARESHARCSSPCSRAGVLAWGQTGTKKSPWR